MYNKAKALTVILIVLMIGTLTLAGGLFYLLQDAQSRNASLQTELEEAKQRYSKSETQLKLASDKVSDLEKQLRGIENKIETLSRELEQETNEKQQAMAKIDSLAKELEEQKRLRSEIEGELKQAKEDAIKTRDQLRALSSEKKDLEARFGELEKKEKGIELGKIVVGQETSQKEAVGLTEPSPAKMGQEGKVLVINKDYNFAVLNLGSKDGVNIGDVFSVYHNNKYVGDVQVEKVHDSMSAAGFQAEAVKNKISEGDRVLQNVK